MKPIVGRVSASGRLSLPADFRKAVGLSRGGDVVIELDGGEIRIRTIGEVIASAQTLTRAMLRDNPGGTVDAFLADRRREAEKE
jgi:bifunctional DNA-binding transcriptional regulator/antitoxin component of YhaV-PrlF toxin-antitoxin module